MGADVNEENQIDQWWCLGLHAAYPSQHRPGHDGVPRGFHSGCQHGISSAWWVRAWFVRLSFFISQTLVMKWHQHTLRFLHFETFSTTKQNQQNPLTESATPHFINHPSIEVPSGIEPTAPPLSVRSSSRSRSRASSSCPSLSSLNDQPMTSSAVYPVLSPQPPVPNKRKDSPSRLDMDAAQLQLALDEIDRPAGEWMLCPYKSIVSKYWIDSYSMWNYESIFFQATGHPPPPISSPARRWKEASMEAEWMRMMM